MAGVCLLVMVWRPGAREPLVVAANRDERLDRPAVAVTVLGEAGPRILGGRDLLAGGTWLAVNEHGVVAGLTNTPTAAGRDPTKRSRGLLPLAAARHRSAREAAAALAAGASPADYNPAWMLVGDRDGLFAVTVAGDRPVVSALAPGTHVLENGPPGAPSAKVRHVGSLLGHPPADVDGEDLRRLLAAVLADHRVAPGAEGLGSGGPARPPETLAACVHAEQYGTRSSALVVVADDRSRPPAVAVADGPPCRSPFVDVTPLWAPRRGGGAG